MTSARNMDDANKKVRFNSRRSTYSHAVVVHNACKSYGKKVNKVDVLMSLNMIVPKGTIYGLLGASGCGKTTLLSCIVGRIHLDSGDITTLGTKPGMLGNRIGYMPQELALYGEFTIRETMLYFGWLFDMEKIDILQRLNFLVAFLDLPTSKRLVKHLSGGQQRRVSLAVALLHDPDLLILDEPTVGVDPILRQTIWEHLFEIVQDDKKTVILTTHYIEEARHAHIIGLMRSGHLLAEADPEVLLLMYKGDTLEEVFLRLSRLQNEKNPNESILDTIDSSFSEESPAGQNTPLGSLLSMASQRAAFCCRITKGCKLKALLYRNYLRIWRNLPMVLFIFVLPVLQVILFCLTIGREPHHLKLAIVNDEPHDAACSWKKGCATSNLGCRYLSYLHETVERVEYTDVQAAKEAISIGKAWGVLHIKKSFSQALTARASQASSISDATIKAAEIHVGLDMSNQQIGIILQSSIQLAYRDFIRTLLADCKQNPKLAELPVQFDAPIYGTMNPTFTDFVAPGVILTILFFLAVGLTASAFVTEKTEGLLDRSLVAGVTPAALLLSHIISQLVITFIQTALVLFTIFVMFDVTNNGNLCWVLVLSLLQGICGMCFGFFISAICDQERSAIQLALGSFYPIMMLSGVMWPIEGMPTAVRYIALILPLTLSTESMRSILTRGWSITSLIVYGGFLSTIAWIIGFLGLTLLGLRFRRL